MPADVSITQTGRLVTLDSPLGDDVLIPTSFQGEEALSRLFSFAVEAISAKPTIAPKDLLGKSVTVSIRRPTGDPRLFNGVVTGFSAGPVLRSGYRRYALTLSPWLWLLDRTSDCRIFQSKSVKDIATTLFSEAGFSDYQFKLQGGTTARDYCVQFDETDFAFLSRLFEQEGIFYTFEHQQGRHVLVIADQASAYGDCADPQAAYRQGEPQAEALHRWQPGWSYVSGKWVLGDYDFTKPGVDITGSATTVLKVPGFSSWERYDYPGRHAAKADGDQAAKLRMEEDEAGHARAAGSGTYSGFVPGSKFTLSEHPVDAETGQAYALVSVVHQAEDNTHFTAALAGRPESEAPKPYYRNDFTCLPAATTFRPPVATPRPVMRGPQTALVVGASGEEIHTDSYGRIRVQFPWDRLGAKDDKSSCWIRVAQTMAGRKWGSLFTPRVGMEVVVDFLDGDPDRPLVTGTVYNADNMPPWDLPANKTQSGWLTRSSAQGGTDTANALRFEDKKGEEHIWLHAEKDFLREVENDDTLTVGHDQTASVKNDRALTIQEGNQTVTVSKGDDSLTVSTGKRVVSVNGDHSTTVKTGNHATAISTGDYTVTASAGKVAVQAMQSIEMKVGGNSITIDQQGITLKGMQIAIQGQMQVQIQGAMTTLKGDATVTVQGGLVKIN